MGTRKHKHKKTNKRFRKKQRGGFIAPEYKLIKDAGDGNVELVREALKEVDLSQRPNAKDIHGRTALIAASTGGHTGIVAMLLENGADVNAEDKDGWTALMFASQNGHTEIVALLLNVGADVDAKNKYKWTALMFASQEGHTEIVALLLNAGADVNEKAIDDVTALMIAGDQRRIGIVRMLLEHGADVNTTSTAGWTAFKLAHRRSDQEIMNLLTQYITIPIMSQEEFATCDTGSEQVPMDSISLNELNRNRAVKPIDSNYCFDRSTLQRWLKNMKTNPPTGNPINDDWINKWYPLGLDENYDDIRGGKQKSKRKTRSKRGGGIGQSKPPPPTANEQLLTAINDDNIEGVEIALSIPEVDINNNNGLGIGPPLLYAVDKGQIEIVELLLDKGADIDSIDVSQQTALMVASGMGHFGIVELLLKRGANVNATENDGYTALIYASSGEDGHPEIVKLLLEKGADVNASENDGYTALIYASQNGHTEIVKMLLDTTKINVRTTESRQALINAIENDHHKIVSMLLGSGVNPYKITGNRSSPFDTARQQNKHETLRMIGQLVKSQDAKHQLINQVPEVKQKQKIPSLKTLTHRQLPSDAISQINPYKHHMLPRGKLGGKRKSRRKTRLKYGGTKQTQLNNLLIWNASKGNLQMVKLVLEKKGDVNMKDEAGDTPLMIAAAYGHEDIVELLLKKGANVNIKNNYGMSVLDAAVGYIMMTTQSSKFNNSKLFNLLNDAGAIRGSNFTHIEPTKFTNTGDRLHKITEPGDDQLGGKRKTRKNRRK